MNVNNIFLNEKISVCISTYNGAKYILEQLHSILPQLNGDDEVIIVDDCSIDNTVNLIDTFDDGRIAVYINPTNCGHVFSFNRAVILAKNQFIFLSDQDDIWENNRVKVLVDSLRLSDDLLVTSNSKFIDQHGNEMVFNMKPIKSKDSHYFLMNIIKVFTGSINYYGCTMAFKKDFKKVAIPIPVFVESHDLWFALCANILRRNLHIDNCTLRRRIHEGNLTKKNRTFYKKLRSRFGHILSVIVIFYRILRQNSGY